MTAEELAPAEQDRNEADFEGEDKGGKNFEL